MPGDVAWCLSISVAVVVGVFFLMKFVIMCSILVALLVEWDRNDYAFFFSVSVSQCCMLG